MHLLDLMGLWLQVDAQNLAALGYPWKGQKVRCKNDGFHVPWKPKTGTNKPSRSNGTFSKDGSRVKAPLSLLRKFTMEEIPMMCP